MEQATFEFRLRYSESAYGRDKCWPWSSPDVSAHAMRVWVNGKRIQVHRHVYLVFRQRGHPLAGELKPRTPLLPMCAGGSSCVNPWHMAPAVSARSMAEPGKWAGHAPNDPRGAHNRSKRHCPMGHPYTPENTEYTPTGQRRCRICHRRSWLPKKYHHILHGNREGAPPLINHGPPDEEPPRRVRAKPREYPGSPFSDRVSQVRVERPPDRESDTGEMQFAEEGLAGHE